MDLAKFLGWIRRVYNTVPNTLAIYGFIAIAVLSTVALIVDNFLPFTMLWNFLRALIAVPLAAAMFILGYAQAFAMHEKKEAEVPDWVSYRKRFSPSWRRRISAIIAAVLVVIAYASSQTPFYTIVTAGILATVIALFAFMRLTRKEKIAESYDLPDDRDINYQKRLKDLQKERAKIEEKARKMKQAKRKKMLTLGAIDETADVEEEDEEIEED